MNDNEKALELLDKIFYSWDIVAPGREGEDLRAPGNRQTAEQSLELINELDKLNITDSELNKAKESYREVLENYFSETEKTENDFEEEPDEIPDDFLPGANKDRRRQKGSEPKGRSASDLKFPGINFRISSLFAGTKTRHTVFSVLGLLGFFFFLNYNSDIKRDWNYQPDMFTLERTAFLQKIPKVLSDTEQTENLSIVLPKGSKVIPLGRAANNFVHAKTETGYQGFVYISYLRAGRYVVNKKTARFYDSPDAAAYKIKPQDTLELLHPKILATAGAETGMREVRHPDGNIYYLRKHDFYYPATEVLPKPDSQFRILSSLSRISRHVGTSTVDDLQERYGPASAVLPSDSTLQVYFRQLTLNSDGYLFDGLSFRADSSGRILALEVPLESHKPFYAQFPGFEQVCGLEVGRFFLSSYYDQAASGFDFLDNLHSSVWIVSALIWLLKMAVSLFILFLFLSLPHFAAFLSVSFIGIFWTTEPGLLKIYMFLSPVFAYFLFLISIGETAGWFWNLLFIGAVYLFWQRRYKRKFNFRN
jgi:hypothetical protein